MTCPIEPNGLVLQQVDSIVLDIQDIQVRCENLALKVNAVKTDLDAIRGYNCDGIDSSSPPRPYISEDDHEPPQVDATDDHPSKKALKHQPTISTNGCSISLPAALQSRYDNLPKKSKSWTVAVTATPTASQKPMTLSLDGRWQDLFDSEAVAITDDVPRLKKSSSWIPSLVRTVTWTKVKESECLLHPHSVRRVLWDLIGLMLLLYDAISIPIYMAWDSSGGSLARNILSASSIYWTLDILLSFNTGFFKGATLTYDRKQIAKHYLRTWMCADVLLVSLDYVLILFTRGSNDGGYMVRGARILRFLRFARGLRLFKVSKTCLMADEFLTSYGQEYGILAIAIFKTLGAIYITAHLAACLWYLIGHEQQRTGPAWVNSIDNFDEKPFMDQYIRSLYWVGGNLLAAPVDPAISPQNYSEMFYTVCLIWMSLLIIGIVVANMSNAVADFNHSSVEAAEAKRKLQGYLHANKFPTGMSVRAIGQVLAAHKKKSAMELDPNVRSLLSGSLLSDLHAWQRGIYLQHHPLFQLVSHAYPEVLQKVYHVCVHAVYADFDTVFKAGNLSEVLYITVHGSFALQDEGRLSVFGKSHFFCEVSLFAQYKHRASLKATTFADSLSIHGADLANCVRIVPSCVGAMHRYAGYYLGKIVEVSGKNVPIDDGNVLVHDVMPRSLAQEACDAACLSNVVYEAELVTPSVTIDIVRQTLDCIMEQDLSVSEIVEQIELAFPEVHNEMGLYAALSDVVERKRSIAAMLGVILLSKNSYDSFVEPQDRKSCMTEQLWDELQRLLPWTALSRDVLHGLLVFLAIRGLGKVQPLLKLVPRDSRTAEDSVLYLMDYSQAAIPSITHLPQEKVDFIKEVLEIQKTFKLAQLMQGENTPYQVQALKEHFQSQGNNLRRFYLLAMVGMMCGLAGAETLKGCMFMDEANTRIVVACVDCLRHLAEVEPHVIYWNHIAQRAAWLALPMSTPEQIAFVRFACLNRALVSDCVKLHEAWTKLDAYERDILVRHFLADGIHEKAFLLGFLPVYLINARNNRVVGTYGGLVFLIDLILLLRSDTLMHHHHDDMVIVNIADVASFTKEVINPLAFESLIQHCQIAEGDEIRLNVSARHWQVACKPAWRPEQVNEIAHEVKRMQRKNKAIEELAKQAVFARQVTIRATDPPATVPKKDDVRPVFSNKRPSFAAISPMANG